MEEEVDMNLISFKVLTVKFLDSRAVTQNFIQDAISLVLFRSWLKVNTTKYE